MTECNVPSVIVPNDWRQDKMLRKPQAEGMIKLKGILKLTVWRLKGILKLTVWKLKALSMLTAPVKDCLLTTFAYISEWLALHVLVNLRATPIWKGSRKIRPRGIPIRKRLLLQGKGVKPYYYKNRALSRTKVCIIYPF